MHGCKHKGTDANALQVGPQEGMLDSDIGLLEVYEAGVQWALGAWLMKCRKANKWWAVDLPSLKPA